MSLVISNATIIDDDPPRIRQGHLLLEGGRIRDIYTDLPSQRAERDWIDGTGCVVLAGFACAHTHLYSALSRGMPGSKSAPRNFKEILEYVWWPLDRALDRDMVAVSGLVGAAEAVRAGVTTLIDHHAGPYSCDGSLALLADAVQEVGLRGVFCYEVSDREGLDESLGGLKENERFFIENTHPRTRGMIGAHACVTLSQETLQALADLVHATGAGLHIHVAEDIWEQQHSQELYQMRVVERLASVGLLSPRTILAHGVHLNERELALIQESGAWLVHNPKSNQNNRVGYATSALQLPKVALGTDGIGADMIEEARFAYLRARDAGFDVGPDWAWSLLHQSQRLAGQLFDEPLGLLRSGAPADIIVLQYDPPTPLTAENFVGHLMYGMSSAMIRDVIVAGRVLMRDRKLVTVNEAKIRALGREQAPRLWQAMHPPPPTNPELPEKDQTLLDL
jgi:putative selenium metabolism protein SsnA